RLHDGPSLRVESMKDAGGFPGTPQSTTGFAREARVAGVATVDYDGRTGLGTSLPSPSVLLSNFPKPNGLVRGPIAGRGGPTGIPPAGRPVREGVCHHVTPG